LSAFELLTLDILIDENHKVWLMDMHRTLTKLPNNNKYWDWVLYNVIMANFGLYTSAWAISHNIKIAPQSDLQITAIPLKLQIARQIVLPTNVIAQKELKLPQVIYDQLILQPLYLANENELQELCKIGSTSEVYKYISNGKKWDDAYIRKLYKESIVDSSTLCRNYYHWLLIYEQHCVGYIGVRPYEESDVLHSCAVKSYLKPPSLISSELTTKMQPPIIVKGDINCYQIRYFISPDYRGKKFASIAGSHVAHFFKSIYPKKTLVANILTSNIGSIKTANSIGMHSVGTNNEHTIMEY
jgi:RimJ/RimL family protein N-acetyltransferase